LPTEIRYSERIVQPYQSDREVRVYGEDRVRRLESLPSDLRGFEKAVSDVARKIRDGTYARMDK